MISRGLLVPTATFLLAAATASSTSAAETIFADQVLEHVPSGAGPMQEPYGGRYPADHPRPRPLPDTGFATDRDAQTWVSLPTGASITLVFFAGRVFDGPGDDLFVCEIGAARERAEVLVSADGGSSFTHVGIADGGTVTRIDLADSGYAGFVNAVRIVGLDSLGTSPGFDVCYVEGLAGSVQMAPAGGAENAAGSIGDLLAPRGSDPDAHVRPPARAPAPSNSIGDLLGDD